MTQEPDSQNIVSRNSIYDALTSQSLKGRALTSIPDKFKQIASVINYLKLTFNTRQGSTASNPDYGLPDFVDLYDEIPEEIDTYAEIIEGCIRKYEPRVKDVITIKWGIEDKTLNLYCILFITLISSKTFRLKFTMRGIGQNTLDLVLPDLGGSSHRPSVR